MRISTDVIMVIIRIMVIKYFRSYRLTKAEYRVGYWLKQAESIRTYKGQVLEQKYCESSMVCVPPFWLTPLKLVKAQWCVYLLSGLLPPTPASSTVFQLPQVSDEDDTEPHIRDKVYMCYELPEETSGIGTAHAELTLAWPKHGYASRSHGTFLHALPRAAAP